MKSNMYTNDIHYIGTNHFHCRKVTDYLLCSGLTGMARSTTSDERLQSVQAAIHYKCSYRENIEDKQTEFIDKVRN